MRLTSRLATIFATGAAAAGAIAAGPPESGFDRPGGVYTNVPAEDAAACAIACAKDKICMSWSFRTTDYVGCSLKAVVPARVIDAGATSGVADRAAEFLSLVAIDPPAPDAPAAEPAPAPVRMAALTATPAFLRPLIVVLASPVGMAQIAPLIAEEEPERLEAPKPFSLAASATARINYRLLTDTPQPALPNVLPILTVNAPASLQRTAMVSASAPPRMAMPAATPTLPIPSVVLPPAEPETLNAPATLRASVGVTSIAARLLAPTLLPLGEAHPITEIAAPAPLDRARLTSAPRPMPPPLSRTGLGAQVTLAIPPAPATPPSPSALPASYAPRDTATFENTAVSSPADDELLGAP